MTYDDLLLSLRASLARLPGLEAQLRMAPHPRLTWDPAQFPDGGRNAAALLLLYPSEGQWHIALTVRGSGLRSHTGQVSLPGGRVDPGESIEAAALRETAEEIGVGSDAIRLVGRLTPVTIPVSGYVLHPVVGMADERPQFQPAAWEVARLVEVPLAELRDTTVVQREWRTREVEGRTIHVETPYFAVGGEQVWGATAMVLAEFLALLEGSADI